MNLRKIFISGSCALTLTLAASLASAQSGAAPGKEKEKEKAAYVETKTDTGSVVAFGDDHLLAPDSGPYMPMVRRPPGVVRQGLLRPRFAFVAEMLKSVEHL